MKKKKKPQPTIFLRLLEYFISNGKPNSGIFARFTRSDGYLDCAAKPTHLFRCVVFFFFF